MSHTPGSVQASVPKAAAEQAVELDDVIGPNRIGIGEHQQRRLSARALAR